MDTREGGEVIDLLERGLLLGTSSNGGCEQSDDENDNLDEEEKVLYTASFLEDEENFLNYKTARWVMYSLLLILAWGIGILMLLYLPVRRYILRKDLHSRKLYVTPSAIVYKVKRPVPFPCFGFLRKEKHILLPSVADIVIEQGYLESRFGVYSVRIENVGVRRPPSDDVQIQGITDPRAFRKAVFMCLLNMRNEALSKKALNIEEVPSLRLGHPSPALVYPSKYSSQDSSSRLGELVILQKLEEVDSSVKRVQTLIEVQQSQTSEPHDPRFTAINECIF